MITVSDKIQTIVDYLSKNDRYDDEFLSRPTKEVRVHDYNLSYETVTISDLVKLDRNLLIQVESIFSDPWDDKNCDNYLVIIDNIAFSDDEYLEHLESLLVYPSMVNEWNTYKRIYFEYVDKGVK